MATSKKPIYIFTADHSGLPLASRLQNEGENVTLVLIHPTKEKGKLELPKTPEEHKRNAEKIKYLNKNATNIVKKMWADDAMRIIKKDDYVIFDQIYGFQFGEALYKRGAKVWGGSKVGYMLETERKQTLKLLGSLGFDIPEQHYFGANSSQKGIEFLKKAKDETLYVFKSDYPRVTTLVAEDTNDAIIKKLMVEKKDIDKDDFLLQQRITGIEMTVETLYSNGIPIMADIDLEAKNKYNETSKVQTGCSFGLSWIIPIDHPLRQTLNSPLDAFAKKYIGTGLMDITVIYEPNDNRYYALEVCGSRFGYNCFYTTMDLLNISLGEFIKNYMDGNYKKDIGVELFEQEYGASLRLFNDGNSPDQRISIDEGYEKNCWLWDCRKEGDDLLTIGTETGEATGIITAHADTPEGAFAKIRTIYSKVHMATAWARDDYEDTDEINLPLSRFHAMEKLKLI